MYSLYALLRTSSYFIFEYPYCIRDVCRLFLCLTTRHRYCTERRRHSPQLVTATDYTLVQQGCVRTVNVRSMLTQLAAAIVSSYRFLISCR